LFSEAPGPAVIAALGDAETSISDLDAAWFSRSSKPGKVTWELRRLTGLPFALVAIIDESWDASETGAELCGVEEQMREANAVGLPHAAKSGNRGPA
jgi:hypothetical protein